MENSNTHLDLVYSSLLDKPKTMKMVEEDTGIDRAYICWAVKKLREQNKLEVFEIKLCKITKHRAGYLTVDKRLFKDVTQYSFFI